MSLRGNQIRIEGMRNLPSCLSRGRSNCLAETQREANACAFPLLSVVSLKFRTFPETTALQRKLLLADFLRLSSLTVLWACSFHCQFHDLKIIYITRVRTAARMRSFASSQSNGISIFGIGIVSASTKYDRLRIANAGFAAGYFSRYHAKMSPSE